MGAPAGEATEHRYRACQDEYCDRFPCRVYKEGYQDGYADGQAEGYATGYAEGFGDGTADGR